MCGSVTEERIEGTWGKVRARRAINGTFERYRKTDGGKGRVVEFAFTEEQEQLRKSVREFAEGEIAPHVMEWDEASHFPVEIIPKLAEMGLLGVIFPQEYGGAGLGYVEYAITLEELARVDGSIGLIVSSHTSLCANHIYRFGGEEQRRRY